MKLAPAVREMLDGAFEEARRIDPAAGIRIGRLEVAGKLEGMATLETGAGEERFPILEVHAVKQRLVAVVPGVGASTEKTTR